MWLLALLFKNWKIYMAMLRTLAAIIELKTHTIMHFQTENNLDGVMPYQEDT